MEALKSAPLLFSLLTNGTGLKKTLQLDLHDTELVSHLEGDFEIEITSPKQYLEAYEKNGFLQSNDVIISWENGVLFEKEDLDYKGILNSLANELNKIRFGGNDLELIAKLSLFFSYYSFSNVHLEDNIYSTYNISFKDERQSFKLNTIDCKVCFQPQKDVFKAIFSCSLVWLMTNEIIQFDILAYSPSGFIKDNKTIKHNSIPHIISNKLDVIKIKSFIEATINYFKVSSLDELNLKICTFSNSLSYTILLPKVISGLETIELKETPYWS